MVRRTWFLAWHDVRVFLRSRSNLMWMFLMPPFFMWVTGMAAGGGHGHAEKTRIVIRAARPGPGSDPRSRNRPGVSGPP